MTSAKRKAQTVVVDTCVILSALMGDSENDPHPKFEASVDELARGEDESSQLVLPAMVMAELHGTSALGGGDIPPEQRLRNFNRVREYIHNTTFIPAELDWRTAEIAGNLAFDHMLKPGDAVIAATALVIGADVLITWDKELLRLEAEPTYPVTVRKPEISATQQALILPP